MAQDYISKLNLLLMQTTHQPISYQISQSGGEAHKPWNIVTLQIGPRKWKSDQVYGKITQAKQNVAKKAYLQLSTLNTTKDDQLVDLPNESAISNSLVQLPSITTTTNSSPLTNNQNSTDQLTDIFNDLTVTNSTDNRQFFLESQVLQQLQFLTQSVQRLEYKIDQLEHKLE